MVEVAPVLQRTDGRKVRNELRPLRFSNDGSEEFFRAVKARVGAYLKGKAANRFGGGKLALKGLVLGASTAGFYLLTLLGDLPGAAALLSAVLFGLSALFLAINIGHEAAHETVAPGKFLNRALQFLTFAPLGADAELWKLRHVKSHHISPNVQDFDVDVGENGVVRLSPNQKHHWYNRWQAYYSPFIFWLVDLHSVFFYDFKYMLQGRMANISKISPTPVEMLVFVLQKIAFVAIMFAIPMAVMDRPWWQILAGALLVTFVNSLVFVYMLIGTHHCEEVDYPDAGATGKVDHGWAHHQLATSMDWSPLSPIANFFAGGANAHAAHHLFPNVSHVHYTPITRIIQEEARRFDIPYHQSTLPSMIASHFRHLDNLGRSGA